MSDQGLGEASGQEARPQPGTSVSHTPGPWLADKSPVFGEWFVRQDPVNWNGMGYQFICALPADKKGTQAGDMFAANARLIAAAPDLLWALKEAVEDLEQTLHWRGEGWECSEDELLGKARAAIAKATSPSASIGGE